MFEQFFSSSQKEKVIVVLTMALLKSNKIRIMYLITAVFLVFVITSSTFPSCQAGNSKPPYVYTYIPYLFLHVYINSLTTNYQWCYIIILLYSISCVVIKGYHSPPPLSTVTYYTYRQCDLKGCGNHCVHKGKQREGCECRTEGVDPSQCCCKD